MVTLAASAYFLTCCRPAKKSTFCFYVEPPKFINLNSYLHHTPDQGEIAVCYIHKKLSDHSLNAPLSCTDDRAWSQDTDQRRRHFLDVTSKRIPLCGIGSQEPQNRNPDETETTPNNEKFQHVTEKAVPAKKPKEKAVEQEKPPKKDKNERAATLSDQKLHKPIKQEKTNKGEPLASPVNQKEEESLKSEESPPKKEKDEPPPSPPDPTKTLTEKSFADIDLTPTKEVPEKPQTRTETADSFSDDIIEKLDSNLVNLEDTFDKFVKKNKHFIQNLVKCLTFQKRKEKELEKKYEIQKQESDAVRIKNEYLTMVNSKQLELFRNELEKGLLETKTVYKAKIKQLENELHLVQEELKYYKKSERKYLEVIESETKQVKRLREKLKTQKAREIEILNNLADVLKFLEDVKNLVDTSYLENETSLRDSKSIGDRENRSIKEVLVSALNCGMESLNVRDLSILHDAIQDRNECLCHQNELCGRNPMTDRSPSQQSINADESNCFCDPQCHYRTSQDYETADCLSWFPSRQKPESKQACFQQPHC